LYLYLTAAKSRQTLEPLRTVIVDEIHALARDKRGAHLMLSLERLDTVAREKPQRLGLSATTRPLDTMRAFLCGEAPCEQVTAGHIRPWDIQVAVPEDELSSVATHEMWGQVYEQLVGLSQAHRTLVVFTNTRRLAGYRGVKFRGLPHRRQPGGPGPRRRRQPARARRA
jgi:ATP-dependent Lhr-like helicase